MFSFTTLHSQSIIRTSDRELYEHRHKKYEDSLALWQQSQNFVWPDNSYKKVTKNFFIRKYHEDNHKSYHTHFAPAGIEPVEFHYKERLGMKGDCICEGFETKRFFIGIYEKPTQKVIFIEPIVTTTKQSPVKSPRKITRTYTLMYVKNPIIPQKNTTEDTLVLKERLTTDHLLTKESFNNYSAKGYPTYDSSQKCWITIDEGYSDKWMPKNNNK